TIRSWSIQDGKPIHLSPNHDWPEAHLEGWIKADANLALNGLKWIGQQVVLPDRTRLDLLGLTREGGLVVAELKRGRVDAGTLMQALGYVVSLAVAPPEWLRSRLNLDDELAAALEDALGSEEGPSFSIMLIGTSKAPELDRATSFLESRGLDVPVSVVTFSSFSLADGSVLLVRDVEDYDLESSSSAPAGGPGHAVTLDGVMRLARDAGVGAVFDQAATLAEQLGLRIKPWKKSITVVPPFTRGRTLVYLRPLDDGKVHFLVSHENLIGLYGADSGELQEQFGEEAGCDLSEGEALLRLDRFATMMGGLVANDAPAAISPAQPSA
ncbi:MAG: hypothetical protein LH630_10190, partial [Actinomycetia bacterium]|nr:hypothetical protein [Actinomycetes bacterium]